MEIRSYWSVGGGEICKGPPSWKWTAV